MYPNEILFDLTLYEIFIFIGIIASFVVFKFYVSDEAMPRKVFNFYLVVSALSIFLGFVFAAVFQAIFNFIKTGQFDLFGAGITFYGGLFGGIISFLVLTVVGGKLCFKDSEQFKYLGQVLHVAPCSVAIAHGFGRIGCLFAGCCHGALSDFGLRMYVSEIGGFAKCIPLQLFEAVFLFVLFVILSILYFKKIHIEAETYCISYGIWRFVIEFFRDDERGSLISDILTPSQGFAIIFIAVGIAIIVTKLILKKKHN